MLPPCCLLSLTILARFPLHLQAICNGVSSLGPYRRPPPWLTWSYHPLVGAVTIRFHVVGRALSDFESPRIGLCVLYGAALASTEFEYVDAGGASWAGPL